MGSVGLRSATVSGWVGRIGVGGVGLRSAVICDGLGLAGGSS